jgi:hypothetical protein
MADEESEGVVNKKNHVLRMYLICKSCFCYFLGVTSLSPGNGRKWGRGRYARLIVFGLFVTHNATLFFST